MAPLGPDEVMDLARQIAREVTRPSPHLREDLASEFVLYYYEGGSRLVGRMVGYVASAFRRLGRDRTFRESVERAHVSAGLSEYGPGAVAIGIVERYLAKAPLRAQELLAVERVVARLTDEAKSGWELCVVGGMSPVQAAEVAGVGAEAMRKRRDRALRYVLDGLTVEAEPLQPRKSGVRSYAS